MGGGSFAQDLVAAHMWMSLAADQGLAAAKSNRDTVAKEMTPEQIAEAQNRKPDQEMQRPHLL